MGIVANLSQDNGVFMNSKIIAEALRRYRKQKCLSVQDVAFLLSERNISVSPKTIYAWENGTNKPDISTMLTLCSIYGIPDLQQALGMPQPDALTDGSVSMPLSPEEQKLILQYRQHPKMHEAVWKLLE